MCALVGRVTAGGLAAGEWALASILKQASYSTCQIGKWHLGEGDYSMPIAYGFDEMRNTSLYHLNAYTTRPTTRTSRSMTRIR
jgi:arylsulfatase A-like enzyme